MKKILFLFLSLLVLISSVSAYQIKYYGKENFKPDVSFIKDIPQKYLDVKFIRFHESCGNSFSAMYWQGGVIDLYNCGDYKGELIHELVHHQQFKHKQNMYNHNYIFYQYQEEIINASS